MALAGRGSEQVMVRVPDGMRETLKAAAQQNGRSMNAEIVERLEASFERPTSGGDSEALVLARQEVTNLRAVNRALRENFEVIAIQLAGPAGENRDEVIRVMTSLRILGTKVPE